MSSRRSFIRKIIYLSVIAALLIPLYLLSHPATNSARGVQGSPGGVLAQLRKEYHLSQSQLGEIDPGSVTIKLATLGLRGVAANILWGKATDYKMKKDWTNYGATLNQITKVQPNFVNVWMNQAWNLSYNVSVEFDDYRERYRWVIKGFDFLKNGITYNDRQPRLQWEMGRMISQKIGKADEVKQFRRLFKEDDDFNAGVPVVQRDNWLVGKQWYERAIEMVDNQHLPMMGQSPLIYRSSAPMCQMSYAEGLEKDGVFGERAKNAWAAAAADWHLYGAENIPTSFVDEDTGEPILIHLNDQDDEEKAAGEKLAQLEKMQPGLRKQMIAEKRANLTAAQRLALDTPPVQRTGNQARLAAEAEEAVAVAHDEVARKVSGPQKKRDAAKRLAKDAVKHEQLARYIRNYRSIVNFDYWRQHAKVEQGDDVLEARGLIYKGDRAYADGDQVIAEPAYERGLKAWRKVLDAHPEYVTDQTTGEDLMDMIRRYRYVLGQNDKSFPKPFILQDVIDVQQKQFGAGPLQEEKKPKDKAAQTQKSQVKKADGKKGK